MKITENLPQFVNEGALLVVSGDMTARFYLANDGIIKEVDLLRTPKIHYSDKEEFVVRGTGANKTSGAVREAPKQYLRSQFLHNLRDEVKHVYEQQKFKSLYLFSPRHMMKEIEEVLPKECCNVIKLKIVGNLVAKHPFALLQIIKNERERVAKMRRVIQPKVVEILSR